jgi:hypothetical protein
MADKQPGRDLLTGITRQGTFEGGPARMFEAMDPLPLIQMIQRMLRGNQPRTPRLDEKLPRFDPKTGGIIEPPGGPMGQQIEPSIQQELIRRLLGR